MDIAPLGGWPYRSKSSNVHKELKCQVILEVVLAFQEGRITSCQRIQAGFMEEEPLMILTMVLKVGSNLDMWAGGVAFQQPQGGRGRWDLSSVQQDMLYDWGMEYVSWTSRKRIRMIGGKGTLGFIWQEAIGGLGAGRTWV